MSLIEWNSSFELGLALMDETHREFVSLLNQLKNASNAEFPALFEAFIQHTREHFQEEEILMRETGFPAYGEHRDEHQRILGELQQFKKRVDKGLIAFGRNYIRGRMPEWFPLHAASMDSALAAHAKKTTPDILNG